MRDFHLPGRSAVFAQNGMCATSHPIAAQTAIDVLKNGGNAMDAALAGALVLTICEPHMTGLGGDCFALFSPAGRNDVIALNGSGRALNSADAAQLREEGYANIPIRSPLAVTTPGAIDAFCTLSDDWGKIGIDAICQPAIRYATQGVPIAPRVAMDWAGLVDDLHPSAHSTYLRHGTAPSVGSVFTAPGQAEVLKHIAKSGRDGFYSGPVADDLTSSLSNMGVVFTQDDLDATRADYTTPISGTFHTAELVEHPPNGQGATAILMLNILKHFDVASLSPFGAARIHLEAEAAKLAYDARNRLIADPTVLDATDKMTSPELAADLANLIRQDAVTQNVPTLTEAVHKDTVYITVVDKDQFSVSLIFSIFHGFGTGIASERFGILYQNRGAGFTLQEGHPNMLRAGHRPMHTIIPAMLVQDGVPSMPFGVMGGQYQPNGHARVLSNMFDFGMDIQTAIDVPRSFAEGGTLKLERGISGKVAQELMDLGHTVDHGISPIGGAQAIRIHTSGVLEGASDPRKDGCAIGY